MSILDDNETKSISLKDVLACVDKTGLESFERGYLHGYFTCINESSLLAREIEKALDKIRDRMGDEVDSDEVEKVRKEIEDKFKSIHNLS